MEHPLVVALFESPAAASRAAKALHAAGFSDEALSIVASNQEAEGDLARSLGASPGVDIEDSRPAARLAELGARLIAAVALVMPGIGPIVAAGPFAAEAGEAAGHLAGGLAAMLRGAGLDEGRATAWERQVEQGAVLIGVHVVSGDPDAVSALVRGEGARDVAMASWPPGVK